MIRLGRTGTCGAICVCIAAPGPAPSQRLPSLQRIFEAVRWFAFSTISLSMPGYELNLPLPYFWNRTFEEEAR
jgi:hypothetical protein